MNVQGRYFSPALCARIQAEIDGEPEISRRELSRRVCRWLDWRAPGTGRLQDMSCRKALVQLARHGLVRLPNRAGPYGFEDRKQGSVELSVAVVEANLCELGEVSVEPIKSRYSRASKIWRELLERYHYLGSGPLCGAQIRYLVKSSRYGVIGALAFSSATWALRCRDQVIGWSEAARRHHLGRVVNNARFIIVPTVRVKNLASHVLSSALSRLATDWQERYGVRPVLVETFVDPRRFRGTCYKAANWTEVGYSAGRRDGQRKKVFLYPLGLNWKEVLCGEPPVELAQMSRPQSVNSWAEYEFATVRLYDGRLKRRLYRLAEDFYADPQASIPQACQSKAKTMAAYRFFSNPKVSMDVILTGHLEATLERIKEHRLVLVPQDTTTLNYSLHPMTEGLGPINMQQDGSIGLILHDSLAFTEEGTPLGIVDAQCWARDPNDQGKRYRRHKVPIDQKESVKWLRNFEKLSKIQKQCPNTVLVSIGDRESDIYELFEFVTRDPQGPRVLVRAEKTRNRQTEHGKLWEWMPQKEAAGCLKIHIPRRGSRKARGAWVEVRFDHVKVLPPKKYPKGTAPVELWAVYVREQPSEDSNPKPIEWMLLTTAPVLDFRDAKKRVEWYTARWGIEVYHRTLKSGCRIKDRQLGAADRLESCLGVDMVVAWRIYHLTMLGRETPNLPCTVFFKDLEWKALCCYVHKTTRIPQKPPSLSEAIAWVGRIGGHLGRKTDGPPGAQTLWRGLQKLDTAVEMYEILTKNNHNLQYTGPSP